MSSSIEFEAVTKHYPGVAAPAVSSFSAKLAAGSTTVLLGSSGCGKTTLLRMVNRMVEPTSGRVLVDGQDVLSQNPVCLRRSIGYVLQNAGLLLHRRVLDNITLVPRLKGENRAVSTERAYELMDLLGLDRALAKRYPHELSGGQAQRVGVARALAADPGVLLMDEPFGAVDPLVRRELQTELIRLQAELAKTIIFVTHDVGEALALGDEIILLRKGAEVAQRGTGPELLAAPADDFVARFLGLDDADRQLSLLEVAGQRVVADASGRAIGRVAPTSSSRLPEVDA
ncbi:Glycine betaine/L-proline transport ATP-binding protein ProV [Actinomyces bovis]|uniref:Glycine betaine/L-proline transport ATP-binding protein ProV n=1 Tax=Actinomyces bovis TaxID=1658 RepID=A0ABY1VMK9_9ACTO|nr:ATP-binding cassette domain-containing protein [Actinomyces bovis]SPT53063.1 Glycine betaine/L-proline transport ATP-binding protein ProV [Actinomyces bovis]VEG52997.1 Glycine betaine/L-proline transport ATP-binding protein ProV [Actinomyces israelii]